MSDEEDKGTRFYAGEFGNISPGELAPMVDNVAEVVFICEVTGYINCLCPFCRKENENKQPGV